MPSVAVVHEQMHQGASSQQQIRQRTQGVRQVLGQQKVAGNGSHDDQAYGVARTPETGCPGGLHRGRVGGRKSHFLTPPGSLFFII
jgi:hypothetical protein